MSTESAGARGPVLKEHPTSRLRGSSYALSIPMHRPQPGREAEDELGAFELGEPVGGDGGDRLGGRRDEPRRAGRAELLGRHPPVGRQRPLAEPRDLVSILAEEDQQDRKSVV